MGPIDHHGAEGVYAVVHAPCTPAAPLSSERPASFINGATSHGGSLRLHIADGIRDDINSILKIRHHCMFAVEGIDDLDRFPRIVREREEIRIVGGNIAGTQHRFL